MANQFLGSDKKFPQLCQLAAERSGTHCSWQSQADCLFSQWKHWLAPQANHKSRYGSKTLVNIQATALRVTLLAYEPTRVGLSVASR